MPLLLLIAGVLRRQRRSCAMFQRPRALKAITGSRVSKFSTGC